MIAVPFELFFSGHAIGGLGQTAPALQPCSLSTPAPGTDVTPLVAQQVMVADRTSGSVGTWARHEWRGIRGGCWVKVGSSAGSHFGSRGVVPAAQRVQGSLTTPAGTFDIKFAFGDGNPGTALPYRVISPRSVWVDEPALPDYNRWRENSTLDGVGIGEDLSRLRDKGFYHQAAVIGFNYDNPIRKGPGSGAAIFLHYSSGPTAGCVGLDNAAEVKSTIAWLDPARHPRIVVKA